MKSKLSSLLSDIIEVAFDEDVVDRYLAGEKQADIARSMGVSATRIQKRILRWRFSHEKDPRAIKLRDIAHRRRQWRNLKSS